MMARSILSLALILLSIFLMLFSLGCGNKRNPTGGEADNTKPTVLASFPAEFEDISDGIIEISFSKPMDRNSLANSIYIYPPVQNKKFSLDRSTLKIKLNEALKQDTNYFITLSTRLKDLRGNPLQASQTLVFRSGKLSTGRISGLINYELPSDEGSPISASLFSQDSLLVYTGTLTGSTYALENLNLQPYLLRSYIDKNQNGRYDQGNEPHFEGITSGLAREVLELSLAYADTSFVRITNAKAASNREIRIQFSEPVASYHQVLLESDKPLQIMHQILENNTLTLLTEPLDSLRYSLSVINATDRKGNRSEPLKISVSGTKKQDTEAPILSFSYPRNGASVNSLSPILELHFSKIIPTSNLKVKLLSGTIEIPVKIISGTGRIHRIQPQRDLPNYSTCILTVSSTTTDFHGNHLDQDYQLQFLPLKRR